MDQSDILEFQTTMSHRFFNTKIKQKIIRGLYIKDKQTQGKLECKNYSDI